MKQYVDEGAQQKNDEQEDEQVATDESKKEDISPSSTYQASVDPMRARRNLPTSPTTAFVASCPRCGMQMVKRHAKKGGTFWGCSRYFQSPACKGTRTMDEVRMLEANLLGASNYT